VKIVVIHTIDPSRKNDIADMNSYYRATRFLLKIYQTVFSQDFHAQGDLDLPPGPKIIAANHLNATDAFHLPFVFHEKLHFFIQGNIFSFPIIGWLLARSGQIPVSLQPALKKSALDRGCDLLKHDQTVVIFPEGILNPDHQAIKAGCGAVWLSLMTGAAIIPVGFFVPDPYVRRLAFRRNGWTSQGRWQTGGRCYLQVGRSWLPRQEVSGRLNSAAVHALTARLMEKIERLSQMAQMDYVNEKGLTAGVSRFG
jgi:1-acyl-sn-glycerol-3-phosphate acyltransferase